MSFPKWSVSVAGVHLKMNSLWRLAEFHTVRFCAICPHSHSSLPCCCCCSSSRRTSHSIGVRRRVIHWSCRRDNHCIHLYLIKMPNGKHTFLCLSPFSCEDESNVNCICLNHPLAPHWLRSSILIHFFTFASVDQRTTVLLRLNPSPLLKFIS